MRTLLALALLLAACAAPEARSLTAPRWRAVLVAGDNSLPVWENATARMATALGARASIRRFSDLNRNAEPNNPRAVVQAISTLNPAPGEGCLVYLTMHGAPERGLVFAPANTVLDPATLDRALTQGCGDAPTVAILSGCYSGIYASLERPNRIIMMAARRDRPSFGCGAGEVYTVYDECLLKAFENGTAWTQIARGTSACVSTREAQLRVTPSEPQLALGNRVGGLLAR